MPDKKSVNKQTVIEEGTEFEGSISSSCDILLSGKVKGDLLAPALTVQPSGSVKGCVKVDQLISQGEISGDIDAQSAELSGKISDDTVINAQSLEVKLSQPSEGIKVTFGNCELRVGERVSGSKTGTESINKDQAPVTPKTVNSI